MEALGELIGRSPAMVAVQAQLRRVLKAVAGAHRPPPVLLRGETGTGKGLLARSLHAASPRAKAPFVSVNCAAIPETLLEAELFGFERGAFTDARHAKPGLFHEAHGGTLFLDETGLLPEPLQAKLLTALDERAVRRLGGIRNERTDCWIIAATSTDLDRARRERRFREDLYHRLSVFTICMPPLRERGEDVLLLATTLLARLDAEYGLPTQVLDDGARSALARYSWPGNVRELANVLERAALLSDGTTITAEMLGLPEDAGQRAVQLPAPTSSDASEALRESLDDLERSRLLAALTRAHWNVARAADVLRVPRNTLRYRIEKHGLMRPDQPVPRRRLSSPAPASGLAPATAVAVPPLRWEMRSVTWLRVMLREQSLGQEGHLLALFAGKAIAFGGELVVQTPMSFDAAFGLEAAEDAPTRAANAALAIRKAAGSGREAPESPAVMLVLHMSRSAVGLGQARPWPAQDALREADDALCRLLTGADPGAIAVSPALAPLLARHFHMSTSKGAPDSGR